MKKLFLFIFILISFSVNGQNEIDMAKRGGYDAFIQKAKSGDPIAQVMVGICYVYGCGVESDESKAVSWFRKAAEQGNASGQTWLGSRYHYGWGGLAKDDKMANYWYKKAAEQGNASAIGNLAYYYDKQQDYTQAAIWTKKAVEKNGENVKYEQARLGSYYLNGKGVAKDYSQAVYWLKKAAEQDVSDAKELLPEAERLLQEEKTLAQAKLKKDSKPMAQLEPKGQPKLAAQAQVATTTYPKKEIDPVDSNIPMPGRANKNTFAIIIANEDYQVETKVDYARNDGEVFKSYCHKTLGLPEKNVHFVANATRNNILGELFWLEQVCKAFKGEASVIFYYAGHGLPDEESGSAYLLPVDGNSQLLPTCYSINELYETLGSLPAKKVTVLMDACFSGAKRNGGMLASARGVAIKVRVGTPKGNMIVLSAAMGSETAYKYDEAKHGLFTYFLLKALKDSKGSITMGELSSYIQDQVKRYSIVENGKSQTPTVQTSNSLRGSWQNFTFY